MTDLSTALIIIIFSFIATMYFFGHRAKTPSTAVWTPMFVIEGAFVVFHVLAWIIFVERSESFQRAPGHNPGYGQAFLVINVLLIGLTAMIGGRGAILNLFYSDVEVRATAGKRIKEKIGTENGWHMFGAATILVTLTSIAILALLTWWYRTLNGHDSNFIFVVLVYALGVVVYSLQSIFTWLYYRPSAMEKGSNP